MSHEQGMRVVLETLSPQRVVLFRALQLGDMLCAVPALRALRSAFPNAHITLAGLPWVRAFARRYPRYLDAVLPCPGLPGLPEQPPEVRALPAFLARAHHEAFDLAIQMHGDGRLSNVFTAWLGGRLSVGFYGDRVCAPLDYGLPYPHDVHEIDRLLRLMQWLGAPACGDEIEFEITDADRAGLAVLTDRHQLSVYACVHPGARDPRRRWDTAAFAAIGDALATQGLRVVITGSEDERGLADAVACSMRAPALNLAGATGLGTLAALLAGANLLVCNDTGVSHLAAALRVPSVVLFSGSDPRRWAPRDRRRHRPVCRTEPDALSRAIAESLALIEGGRVRVA